MERTDLYLKYILNLKNLFLRKQVLRILRFVFVLGKQVLIGEFYAPQLLLHAISTKEITWSVSPAIGFV